jgi:putative isomerase
MDSELQSYGASIRQYLEQEWAGMLRPAGGNLPHPFITPGSRTYADVLWDWDSWWADIALRQILQGQSADDRATALLHERGCVLNYTAFTDNTTGWMPIVVGRGEAGEEPRQPLEFQDQNWHKPCLAQHAAFLLQQEPADDGEWLRQPFEQIQRFVNGYMNHHRDQVTGLYYWQDCNAVGVDNDPCSYFRPPKSCCSIYLNCLMHQELQATVCIGEKLGLSAVMQHYRQAATNLRDAMREHLWDEWTGFYYSADRLLLPRDHFTKERDNPWKRHVGMPRQWDCLLMRIGVWSGFLALWAGIATPEQAERMVQEHLRNPATFQAAGGVRTLSKMEKQYDLRASGNPSSWLGPIWGIANYMTWSGLLRYGFEEDARELAEKTVRLFGRDIQRFGAMHEYYEPESTEPIINRGFMNWNCLVLNMLTWLEGGEPVREFR